MKQQNFTKFRDLLDWVTERQRDSSKEGGRLWFRGQRRAEWPLRAKLVRETAVALDAAGLSLQPGTSSAFVMVARELERQLYREFERRAASYLSAYQRDRWGLVFAAQHYGLPTRLLDWTETFSVALYFASLGDAPQKTDVAVFVLEAERFNRSNTGTGEAIATDGNDIRLLGHHPEDPLPSDNRDASRPWPVSLALQPLHTNERIARQRGTFVISGGLLEDLDSATIVKCVLAADALEDLREYLENAGIGESFVFPGLDHLAGEVSYERTRQLRAGLLHYGARDFDGDRVAIPWAEMLARVAQAERERS